MVEIKTVACDFGNFELKTCINAYLSAIRSIHYKLPKGVNALSAKAASPIVEFNGDRYHYSRHEKTVVLSKEILAQLHLYASLGATNGTFKLIVSHHSPDVVSPDLVSALIGTHRYRTHLGSWG